MGGLVCREAELTNSTLFTMVRQSISTLDSAIVDLIAPGSYWNAVLSSNDDGNKGDIYCLLSTFDFRGLNSQLRSDFRERLVSEQKRIFVCTV
jgi:hypothetical protein